MAEFIIYIIILMFRCIDLALFSDCGSKYSEHRQNQEGGRLSKDRVHYRKDICPGPPVTWPEANDHCKQRRRL